MAELSPIQFIDPNRNRVSEQQDFSGIAETAEAVNAGMDNATEREFRENVQETIQDVVNPDLQEVTVDQIRLTGDEDVDNLRRRMKRLQNLANQGGANARARARLLIKQELATEVANKPWMRDRLIQAANQELSISPDLEAADLQAAGGEQASAALQDIKDFATKSRSSGGLGLLPHIDITSPEGAAIYIEAARHHEGMRQQAMLVEQMNADRDMSVIGRANAVQLALIGDKAFGAEAAAVAMEPLHAMYDYLAQNSGQTIPNEALDQRFAVVKENTRTELMSQQSELENLKLTFTATERTTDVYKATEALIDGQIRNIQRAIDALDTNDINTLKAFEIEQKARRAAMVAGNPAFQQYTDVMSLLDPQMLQVLEGDLSGAFQLTQQSLAEWSMEVLNPMITDAQSAIVDMFGRSGIGSVGPRAAQNHESYLRNVRRSQPGAGLPEPQRLQKEYESARAALTAASSGNANKYSSDEVLFAPLNSFAGAVDEYAMAGVDEPAFTATVLDFYSNPKVREHIENAEGKPGSEKVLVNLGNQGEKYLTNITVDEQTRNANLQAQFDRTYKVPFKIGGLASDSQGGEVLTIGNFIELDEAALDEGRVQYRVNSQAIANAIPNNAPARARLREQATEVARSVGQEITKQVEARRTIDKLQVPGSDYMPFMAAIEAYGFGQFLEQ